VSEQSNEISKDIAARWMTEGASRDFTAASKAFTAELKMAIKAKKQGMFSPEAERFTTTRLKEILSLLEELNRTEAKEVKS
jgi:hypothetical protein